MNYSDRCGQHLQLVLPCQCSCGESTFSDHQCANVPQKKVFKSPGNVSNFQSCLHHAICKTTAQLLSDQDARLHICSLTVLVCNTVATKCAICTSCAVAMLCSGSARPPIIPLLRHAQRILCRVFAWTEQGLCKLHALYQALISTHTFSMLSLFQQNAQWSILKFAASRSCLNLHCRSHDQAKSMIHNTCL